MQPSHAVCRGCLWNLPSSHGLHAADEALGAMEPGRQGTARGEPTEHDVPAGHVTHSLWLVMKARAGSACVPAGQGCGAEEPSTQSDPCGQSRHAVLRSEDVYLPPGHRVHTGILAFSPKEPGRQLAGADDPEGQLVPAGQVMHWLRLIMKSSDELL